MIESVDSGPVRIYSPGVAHAMLRRESQRVALADRLRARWQESEREKRHAAGLSLRMALDIGAASNVGASIRWADYFPGAFQIVQTDLGLTYGGTTLAAGTTPPVGTLSGALATTPVPIKFACTNAAAIGSGATFNVYYDGGTTPAMTGITPSVGTPVALTGAASGLSHAWAAGTAALNNTWAATCSGLADQSGNLKHYAQATASKQPVITVGLNGKAGILGDGVSKNLVSALNLPAPGTTPHYLFAVFRQLSFIANSIVVGHTTGALEIFQQLSGNLSAYHGTILTNNPGAALGAWVECETTFTNGASDPFKLGTTTITGPMGNTASTGLEIFSLNNTRFGNAELLALVLTPNLPNWVAVRAAVNSTLGYGVGNVLV